MLWTRTKVLQAADVLRERPRSEFNDSLAELAVLFGEPVTRHSLQKAFARFNLGAPTKYCSSEELPTPGAGDGLGGSLFENLADKTVKSIDGSYIRRLERFAGRREYLAEVLSKALQEAFSASPIVLSPRRHQAAPVATNRLLTALVSDVHFGCSVDPREVLGNEYNWRIAARRMARLATQIAEWKPEHRADTRLQIVINGDLLAGLIHLDDSGIRLLTEQIHGATSILVAFIDYLRQFFSRIDVLCLPGNHDRVKRERQVAQRWDSHAHAVYLAISQAFRSDDSVRFDVPLTGEGTVVLPGDDSLAFYTHGDVAPTIANVGRALDIKPIVSAIHKLNSSGEFDLPVRVVGWGHFHQGLVMPTGIATAVVNGSVIGPDSYARNGVGVRGNSGAPMQLIFESVPGYPFGDSRFIYLRPGDADASLDAIIATPDLRAKGLAA